MLARTHSVFLLLSFITADFNKCNNHPNQKNISVVGIAKVIKHAAFVETADNSSYFLDELDDWDDKYLGKKVKVKGRLVYRKEDESPQVSDSITALPQRRYGTWKVIMNPKVKLVE
jgi:hypothetical protein